MIGTRAGQMHTKLYATIGTIEERAIGIRRIFKHFFIHGTNRCVEFWMYFWYVLVQCSNFLGHCAILGYLLEKGAKKLSVCAQN